VLIRILQNKTSEKLFGKNMVRKIAVRYVLVALSLAIAAQRGLMH
jgi:hypothetical protein